MLIIYSPCPCMRVCASRLAWDCSSSDWRHQPGDSRGPAWGYRDIDIYRYYV